MIKNAIVKEIKKERLSCENMVCDGESEEADDSCVLDLYDPEVKSSSEDYDVDDHSYMKYNMSICKSEIISDQSDVDQEDKYYINSSLKEEDSDWSEVDTNPTVFQFTGEESLKVDLSKKTSAIDVFSLLFDDLLISKIVAWTNSRATSLLKTFSAESHLKNWTNVTIEEMKKFLGLCIMMGNIHMPTFHNYWSTNMLYHHPLFGATMTKSRFEVIIQCLHFHNENDIKSNQTHKINQVLNHLLQNIENIYYPCENLSIKKPKTFLEKKDSSEIILHELTTPGGFLLNILIHTRNETICSENSYIVNELLKKYLRKGHTVYLDSFYNSVQLATYLYTNLTHSAGILKFNLESTPNIVEDQILSIGDYIFRRKDNILVDKWKDDCDILTVSTKHKALLQEVISDGFTKYKPQTVIDCNKYLFGSNRDEEIAAYHSMPQKTNYWYQKVFFYLFDVAIWNGFWLFNKRNSIISYVEYRNYIAVNLLNINAIEKPVIQCGENFDVQHFPFKLNRRLRCRVCSTKKLRTATWYSCETCKTNTGEPIGLCADKCFKIYHKKT